MVVGWCLGAKSVYSQRESCNLVRHLEHVSDIDGCRCGHIALAAAAEVGHLNERIPA